MKKLLLLAMAFCSIGFGIAQQCALKYTYDNAGNRTKREVIPDCENARLANPNNPKASQEDITDPSALEASNFTKGNQASNSNNVTSKGDNKVSKTDNQDIAITKQLDKIEAYPNPNKGIMQIDVPAEAGAINLVIQDFMGQVVYSDVLSGGSQQYNLTFLSNGIYMLKLNAGNAKRSIRFVKED